MLPLGLPAAHLESYRAQLVGAYKARTRVEIRSLDDEPVKSLTGYLADGQVNVDRGSEVTRSATLVFNDPRRRMPFDSDDPSDTSLFMDRMLRVSYDVWVDVLDDWINCPIFTGPIQSLSRDGDVVTVDCHGKEALALGALWAPMTLPKGMKKTDAIRRLLGEKAGETRFDIPDLPARLPRPLSLHRADTAWAAARKIARSMNRQLFYDGRGTLRLRRIPSGEAAVSFTSRQYVTSPIQVTFSSDVVNAVWVLGGVPKGSKTHVHASAVAPAAHPWSPFRLGRDDAPRYLMPGGQVVVDDNVKTVAEAQRRADRILADGLIQGVEVQFESMPVPFLDPGDLCHVAAEDGSVTFRLNSFTLPVVAGASMTVGFHKDLRELKVRRHPRPKHPHRPKRRRAA